MESITLSLPRVTNCFEILLESLNLKSYREKPYKNRSHGKEAKQNLELYESSQINLYYRIQLYLRSHIKPGAVGKKPTKPGAV